MKYVYTAGSYREFRGYVFANGNPVTIRDRATLEAIERDGDFKRLDDFGQVDAAPPPPPYQGKPCDKCGKMFVKGWYFHQKYCKG